MFDEQVEEKSEALKTTEIKIADLKDKRKTSHAEQEIQMKFQGIDAGFASPVHARFLTFAHFRFSILNILTF